MTSTRATRSPRRRGRPIWGVAAALLTAGAMETGVLQVSPAGAAVAAETGTTVQVSTVSSAAELPAINGDGRYVVFVGRSKANWGVYLHDQLTGATERLTTGNDMNPAISQNGQFVAYARYGSDREVYLLDRKTGKTTLESVTSSGTAADGQSDQPSVSADGRYVAFQSSATNLGGSKGHGGPTQVYVHDNLTGTTTMVSVAATGGKPDGNSVYPDLTPDGLYVAFASAATDLLAAAPTATAAEGGGETSTIQQVFVRDLATGTTREVSVSSAGVAGDAGSALGYGPSISDNGQLVAFESDATNLVPGDTNAEQDAFVHDVVTGQTTRVSTGSDGAQVTLPVTDTANPPVIGGDPQLSGDGHYVAFQSQAALTPDDTNGVLDVYRRDLQTGALERVSVPAPGGTEASGTLVDGHTGETVAQINGSDTAISTDGRYMAFTSNGNLAGARGTGDEGTISTEPAVFARTVGLPTVTSVSPVTMGRGRVDRRFTVTGSNFSAPSAPGDLLVDLGPGVTVTSTTWISSSRLSVSASVAWDAPLGQRVAQVTNPGADAARRPDALTITPRGTGYRLATAAGGVAHRGTVRSHGSMLGHRLGGRIVGMAETPSGNGYWLAGSDGGVFAFGDAHYDGSLGGIELGHAVVGIAAMPDGKGYWLATTAGNVFDFGAAHFYGSRAGKAVNGNVVGIAAAPDGKGYWLTTTKGSVYDFGSAHFYGSRARTTVGGRVVGIAAAPDGKGYWLTTTRGSVYDFGSARFYGSLVRTHLASPVAGITVRPDGGGYWIVTEKGRVYALGNARSFAPFTPTSYTGPATAIVAD